MAVRFNEGIMAGMKNAFGELSTEMSEMNDRIFEQMVQCACLEVELALMNLEKHCSVKFELKELEEEMEKCASVIDG